MALNHGKSILNDFINQSFRLKSIMVMSSFGFPVFFKSSINIVVLFLLVIVPVNSYWTTFWISVRKLVGTLLFSCILVVWSQWKFKISRRFKKFFLRNKWWKLLGYSHLHVDTLHKLHTSFKKDVLILSIDIDQFSVDLHDFFTLPAACC